MPSVGKGVGLFCFALTPAATRNEAGSRSSLRSSDEPSSRLCFGETAALSVVHRDGAAGAGDLLPRVSPQALAREKKEPDLSQVHRDGEAVAGDPLPRVSPKASAREKKELLSPTEQYPLTCP